MVTPFLYVSDTSSLKSLTQMHLHLLSGIRAEGRNSNGASAEAGYFIVPFLKLFVSSSLGSGFQSPANMDIES